MDDQDLQPISSPTAVKIVDAASHLFLQRGYKAVSITDIIRAAEITKPTLYYYFSDKEELFAQMGLRVLASMGAQLRAAMSIPGDTITRLQAVASAMLADSNADMRMMRHEMFEHMGPANRDRLARAFYLHLYRPVLELMEEGMATGVLTGRFSPLTLTNLFLSLTESFHEFKANSRMAAWSSEQSSPLAMPPLGPDQLVDLFLNGVRAS
ncbi:MAG: TetR/AcrR family transcriptional regulator [Chloroflexi bacterium OHK40]